MLVRELGSTVQSDVAARKGGMIESRVQTASDQGTRFNRAVKGWGKNFLAPQASALPIHAKTEANSEAIVPRLPTPSRAKAARNGGPGYGALSLFNPFQALAPSARKARLGPRFASPFASPFGLGLG